jgi:hypothetical protein
MGCRNGVELVSRLNRTLQTFLAACFLAAVANGQNPDALSPVATISDSTSAPDAAMRDTAKVLSDSVVSEPDSIRTDSVAPTPDSVVADSGGRPREIRGRPVGSTVTVKGVARHKRKEISTSVIRREEIKKVVATAQDPLRALPTLPGVSAASDLSVRPIVRGGDQSETGVSLDGVSLLMPYHFGSVFSVFHREAIEDFQLYSGVAPSSAEGALSGTVVSRSRQAPTDSFYGGADISLLRGSAWAGIPLWKDRVGLWVSGQSLWYDWTVKRLMDLGVLIGAADKEDVEKFQNNMTLPTTWDVQGSLSAKLDRNWLLDVGGFVAGDEYRVQNQITICLQNGKEIPCPNSYTTTNQFGVTTEECWTSSGTGPCPKNVVRKQVADTEALVELSNWMSRVRLGWTPSNEFSMEGVFALQGVDWDVRFPGYRDLVQDSTTKDWHVVRVSDSESFDWTRNVKDLNVSGRLRWNENHETSLGLGWRGGEENAKTHLVRPLAQLILGTTGNPLEFMGVFNDKEILVTEGYGSSYIDLEKLADLDFNYDGTLVRNLPSLWMEHKWDLDARTRIRAGLRATRSLGPTVDLPNPRLQIQHQATEKDLFGLGFALHTQSDLPFEWRLAATTPLVSEKAWLGIAEWEHSFAPGWRSTISAWGKLYQDLASSRVVLDGMQDSSRYNSDLQSWLYANYRRLGISDSLMFSWGSYRWDPSLTVEENQRNIDSLNAETERRRMSYIPESVRQDIAWWNQTRHMTYESTGEGWAAGFEASLRYQPTEAWTGWASAEWSMSRRKDRADGAWYPFGLERPWKLSWVNAFRIDKKWEVSVRYGSMGGNPYTPFKLWEFDYNNRASDTTKIDTTLWVGRRNSGTFMPYQRLDLRLSRESKMFGKQATFYYEVWNALNDPNFVLRDSQTEQVKWVQFNIPFPVVFLGMEVRF